MRHMFFGGNTPNGFVSFYDNALKKGNRLFLLKGGSGVGKHTLMKKIGNELEKRGYEIDYLHCSNDPDSLDGIMVPKLQCGILDGTAPHQIDPKLPGCFDEIVDLGVYLDTSALEKHKPRIMEIRERKKALYDRAYRYLSAAKIIMEDSLAILTPHIDTIEERALQRSVAKEIFTWGDGKGGEVTHLFASAYTSKGYVDTIASMVGSTKVIGIRGGYLLNKRMMAYLYRQALQEGYNVLLCHSPIMPEKIDHILLDGVSILSMDEINKYHDADEFYDIAYLIDRDLDENAEIHSNNELFDAMVGKSMSLMHQCLELHEELESMYIPHMDFTGADCMRDTILDRILSYENSAG